MDLRATVGINQLQRVNQRWRRSQEIWQGYNQAFVDLPTSLPADLESATRYAYQLYTVSVDEARTGISQDGFLVAIVAQNIGVSVYYLSPPELPHSQRTYDWKADDCCRAMCVGRQAVSSRLSAKLTSEDVEGVIRAVEMSLASEYK